MVPHSPSSTTSSSSSDDNNSPTHHQQPQPKQPSKTSSPPSQPFLDTFYSLSSTSSQTRSNAARSLLHHCFFSSSDDNSLNVSDASYAFRRLLDGLNSGRANARQGFAAALSSFLRLVNENESRYASKLMEGKVGDDEKDLSWGEYVRRELLKRTERVGRGSEERDSVFGRLFGIMAVCRSGMLKSCSKEICCEYASDIISLYHWRKWIREGASHALTVLFSMLPNTEYRQAVLINAILPRYFARRRQTTNNDKKRKIISDNDDNEDGDDEDDDEEGNDKEQEGEFIPLTQLKDATAEQIAVLCYLQKHYIDDYTTATTKTTSYGSFLDDHSTPLPLQKQHFETLSSILFLTSSSSTVISTQQAAAAAGSRSRRHFVWQILLSYLIDPTTTSNDRSTILSFIFHNVVSSLLLSLSSSSSSSSSSSEETKKKITHERRVLALALISDYLPHLTSSSEITIVATTDLITRLFIHPLSSSSFRGGAGQEHSLKPLTQSVLDQIITSLAATTTTAEADNNNNAIQKQRMVWFLSALLRADSRFDHRTHTKTIERLTKSCFAVKEIWSVVSVFEEGLWTAEEEDRGRGYIDGLYALPRWMKEVTTTTTLPRGDEEAAASETDGVLERLRRRLTGTFFLGGHFDWGTNRCTLSKLTKITKKKGGHAAAASAAWQQSIRDTLPVILTHSKKNPPLSASLRRLMSIRFSSLLSDELNTIIGRYFQREKAEGVTKAVAVADFLEGLMEAWDMIVDEKKGMGVKAYGFHDEKEKEEEGDDDDDDDDERGQMTSMVTALRTLWRNERKTMDMTAARSKLLAGGMGLVLSLYFQLLKTHHKNTNDDDDESDVVNPDDHDDDDDETLIELIGDLCSTITRILSLLDPSANQNNAPSSDDDDRHPLALLADISIASFQILENAPKNSPRAASSKMITHTVKWAWLAGIHAAAEVDGMELKIDETVMRVLLDTVCGDDAEGDDKEDDDEEGETNVAFSADMMDDDTDDDNNDDNDDDDDDDENDDIKIDQSQLSSILETTSDDNDDDILEHHAGADAALSQLIKLRQSQRKSSQQIQKRIQFNHRRRCMVLLESVLSLPGNSLNHLASVKVLLDVIMPLLRLRRRLEKEVTSSTGVGEGNQQQQQQGNMMNEIKSLLTLVSSLMKNKINKTKLSQLPSSSKTTTTKDEYYCELMTQIMNEAKLSPNKDHCSYCSMMLLFVVKIGLPQCETMTKIDSGSSSSLQTVERLYMECVEEWSSKKNTKLHAVLFDDFMNRFPRLARQVLVTPLTNAASNACSPFLKSEAFRILSRIYDLKKQSSPSSPSKNKDDSTEKTSSDGAIGDDDIDILCQKLTKTAFLSSNNDDTTTTTTTVVDSLKHGLTNDDLTKAKRIRTLLKTMDIVVSFAERMSNSSDDSKQKQQQQQPAVMWNKLDETTDALRQLQSDSQSDAVTALSKKLLERVSDGVNKWKNQMDIVKDDDNAAAAAGEKDDDETMITKDDVPATPIAATTTKEADDGEAMDEEMTNTPDTTNSTKKSTSKKEKKSSKKSSKKKSKKSKKK